MADDHDPIVISTATACLHRSDLETLKQDEWVGDNVLAFHAEWLDDLAGRLDHSSSAPPVKMLPPSVVELLGSLGAEATSAVPMPSERFLLLPISDRYASTDAGHSAGGSHWSLLVVDAQKGDNFHLDSLDGINHDAASTVHNSVCTLVQTKSGRTLRPAKPRKVDCLQQQTNSSDCGIYVLFLSSLLHRCLSADNAELDQLPAVVEDICTASTPAMVTNFRHKYLSWLQTWGNVTQHQEHIKPNEHIRAGFLDLFSDLDVE